MKMTRILALGALVLVAGCDSEGITRPPPTDVRFFHAARNYEQIQFRREQQTEATLTLGDGLGTSFDSGPYEFSLIYTPVGAPASLLHAATEDLSPDRDYTFVIVAPGGDPQYLPASTESVTVDQGTARITFVHAHADLGNLDFYLQPPGTPLAGASPGGSTDFGPDPTVFEVAPDTLRIYITPAGNPGDVIFESTDIQVEDGSDNVFVVYDSMGQSVSDLSVSAIIGTNSARIGQVGLDSELRAVQAVDDRMDRDVLLDEGTPPLFPALPFGELSAYAALPSPPHEFSLTPVATPGTIEETFPNVVTIPGRSYTLIFAGDTTDGITSAVTAEDTRSIAGQSIVRAFHAAGLFDEIDLYLAPPGTDIANIDPAVRFNQAPEVTPRLPLVPGEYELTIQDIATDAILHGPVSLTFTDGGVYGFLLTNAADSSTVDIQYIYDLAP